MNVSSGELELMLRRFGHDAFRPGQKRVIRDLLQGRDVMAVLPTGAGKSLVFQLASQLLPGLTVVISPLIALMKDQVQSLEDIGIPVGVINSSQTGEESARELQEVVAQHARLLYVTPERFNNPDFMAAMRGMTVSLFVVDEAHCMSEWGHDFRPSYLGLGNIVKELGRPTILALTATATPWVRREIVERLGMRDPDIVVRGVDRPNLFFEVMRVESEFDERRALRQLFTEGGREYAGDLGHQLRESMQGSGIIYTMTTDGARQTAEWLNEWGIPADYYHGQRKKPDRERVQEQFMSGDLRVIAATNAFGLGVDKRDVRFVIHRDVPGSVEAYYQEAGRAGRDGDLARCTLIYRPGDLGRAAFLSGTGQLTYDDLQRVRFGLLKSSSRTTMRRLSVDSGMKNGQLARVIQLLSDQGIVTERRGHIVLKVDDFDPGAISLEREEQRRVYERSRLEMMRGYAELAACRRGYILNYFGQDFDREHCERCDNDLLRIAEPRLPGTDRLIAEVPACPFALGDRVVHDAWGHGEVQRVADDAITVLFEEAGYRTVALEIVQQRGLLRKVDAPV